MRIRSYDIAPALQPYIKLICTMECNDDADTNYIRVLPDACVELFLNYTTTPVAIIDNQLYKNSIATFRMSRPVDVHMRKGQGVVAICFHAGMAYEFIRIPMNALSDSTVALADIWGCVTEEMEDKMASSPHNEARIGLIQKYLIKMLGNGNEDRQLTYCLRQMQLSAGEISAGKLAADAGLSLRHLARKFQEHIGLSPKEYLRVSRFIRSLDHLKRYPAQSLTEIAYESGYYDQAHFIRDYKDYTGYTPGQIIKSPHILY
jgi:AraC-like DNA-binding protein